VISRRRPLRECARCGLTCSAFLAGTFSSRHHVDRFHKWIGFSHVVTPKYIAMGGTYGLLAYFNGVHSPFRARVEAEAYT
jgi:hypothetical protein